MNPGHEIGFTQPLTGQPARGNPGDHARRRVRQDVVAGLAIEVDRLIDLIEVEIGSNTGHLQRSVAARCDASGFVVVPEDGGHGLFLNLRPAKSRRSSAAPTSHLVIQAVIAAHLSDRIVSFPQAKQPTLMTGEHHTDADTG
ncbi:hypothetical protein D3C78_1426720 [compost metagenome]